MNRCAPPKGWPVPQSLYVHVPFCARRCGYCNFSVLAGRDDLQTRFLDALAIECSRIDCRVPLQTLFFGGGTPTRLEMANLTRLFKLIRDRFPIAEDAEITAEANPEDISSEMLDVLVAGGVNRISLGVQSFDQQKLTCLQRSHTDAEAIEAIRLAASKIPNVSIDLIFATPGESPATWRDDLAITASLPITHVSTYCLTYEKGTTFWNQRRAGKLKDADEDVEIEMIEDSVRILGAAGFGRYEISSFSKTHSRCRHNLAYWAGRGWYAVGPGAARFVDGNRQTNHRSSTTYMNRIIQTGDATEECDVITVEQYARERAAFGVRLIDGVDLPTLHTETGFSIEHQLSGTIQALVDQSLVTTDDGRLRLTPYGLLFADTVASRLLSDACTQ